MKITDESVVRQLLLDDPGGDPLPDATWHDVASLGALLKGHFALMSGAHSEYFIRFSQIGRNREATDRLAALLIASSGKAIPLEGSRLLCSESAGIFLAEAINRRSGPPLAVTRIDRRRRPVNEWLVGRVQAGDHVIVVCDIITQGLSLVRLLEIARLNAAVVTGVLAFAALKRPELLGTLKAHGNLRGKWLFESRWPTWAPEQCPRCLEGGVPLSSIELA